MIYFVHLLIVAAYIALPLAALALATVRWLRGDHAALVRFAFTLLTGGFLGLGVVLAYAYAGNAQPRVGQALLAGYFATSLLILLRLLDQAVRRGIHRLLGVSCDAHGRPADPRDNLTQLAYILRLVLMVAIALPYVMAALVTYRPKAVPRPMPQARLRVPPERVTFTATDGTRLAGWWIASQVPGSVESQRTVIVCHGLGVDKAEHLLALRVLLLRGYNIFVFDFRGHGASGGQLISFGDRERYDVLGAVQWVRRNHPQECQRIFGVGVNTGAAALIAAAADPSEAGQAISAIAVYGCYDDLASMARESMAPILVPPLRWLAVNVGVPLAGVQTGEALWRFSPADLVPRLWPRPILIIHGQRDTVVDFQSGWRLYNAATLPKEAVWLDGDLEQTLRSNQAAAAVDEFFRRAEAVPAI